MAAAKEHFLFVGSTGSGKTVLINQLIATAFEPKDFDARHWRALVYDAKCDIVPTLGNIFMTSKPGRLILAHPFDVRGCFWDIAADVVNPVVAQQIAKVLVPELSNSNATDEFFSTASRDILQAAMLALMVRKPERWSFRDLILLSLDTDRLSKALESTPGFTPDRVRRLYLIESDQRTRSNLLSSLSAKIGVYEPVAAAWATATRGFSVSHWARSRDVLVLGNDEAARSVIDPINRAIFQRASEEILNLPENAHGESNYTWFVLDEFREAGKLQGLRTLMNKGRSKGACVVLGCQEVEGVRAVYGREEGNEILGQCAHKIVLNVGSPETAQWAVGIFGEVDMEVETTGQSVGNHYSANESTKFERKSLFSTREFLAMPKINPSNGMSGYHKSPILETSEKLAGVPQVRRIAPWKHAPPQAFSWDKIAGTKTSGFGEDDSPLFTTADAYSARPASSYTLYPWTAEELKELGFNPENPGSQDLGFEPER